MRMMEKRKEWGTGKLNRLKKSRKKRLKFKKRKQ